MTCELPVTIMEQKAPRTYLATLGDLELKTWDSDGRYPWTVTNPTTGQEIARGEVIGLENAMVAAAQAVQAEWGALRWRSSDAEDEE
jgi:hypothetical protein